MALTIITFFVDNLFLFWLPVLLQWIRSLHYCLCPMLPFFCCDSHLLSPTPPGCWAQRQGSTSQHQGEGRSAEKISWVLSRTNDYTVVRHPGVVVCSARGFALLEAEEEEEEEEEAVFFIIFVSRSPAVRFSACFSLCPSCVFHLSRNHWLCLK